MAQTMLQVSRMWYDPQHADIQRFQQTALLRGVSLIINQFLFACIHFFLNLHKKLVLN